jgi:tetratricopeptide (TPR) repeat protein
VRAFQLCSTSSQPLYDSVAQGNVAVRRMGESATEQSAFARDSFIGRERELAELVSACEAGADGDAHLFLIHGEPGIGKTRLADELALRVKSFGPQVLWGRCWEGDGAPAYWPWIQVIRSFLGALDPGRRKLVLESEIAFDIVHAVAQIIPDLRIAQSPSRPQLTDKFNPNEARFRLFDAVTNFLKIGARTHPMLIVLDDLHDADEASLALLHFMARELKGAAIMIVATYRDMEVRRSPSLSKVIGELSREGHSIPVGGLNEFEVTKLVEFRAGRSPDDTLVAKLCAATKGNPLFVDGIVRNLIAERAIGSSGALDRPFKIPNGIQEAIRSRLDGLSPESNSVLAAAAAIGNEFDFDLCRIVADVSAEEAHRRLDEASSLGIAEAIWRGRYRFSHALIREAVYDQLDTNGRFRIHGKIANWLEETYLENIDPHLAELAHHFREAGVVDKAIEYSLRAAKAASAVFAHSVAVANLREVVALSEGQKDSRRAAILVRLGRLEVFHFDPAEGVAHLEAALRIYQELKDEEKTAATKAFLGLALSQQPDFAPGADFSRALAYFRQAQAWSGPWTDLRVFGWLHQGLAGCLFSAARIDEAIVASQQARQVFERDSNPAWVMAASEHARLLVIKGRHRAAAAVFDEVSCVVQGVAEPELFRLAMFYNGWCRILMRDPIEAKRFLTVGMERKGLSADSRARHFEGLAVAELVAGDLQRAKSLAAEHRVMPSGRSQIALREGDWEAAIEMGRTMLEWACERGHRWDEALALLLLLQIRRVTGDFQRADECFRQLVRAYEPTDLSWEMRCRPEAALLAIEAGRPEEAVQHLEICRAIIEQGEDWLGLAGAVERAEGVVAAAQDRSFAPHFENAIATFRRYSLPWDEADALHDWGVALNKAAEYSGAREKFDAAIEIYRPHGAGQRWIDRVEAARHLSVGAPRGQERAAASPSPSAFRREGEFWTISYGATTFRLRDAKGLRYMAYLLARPGQRIHVHDLIDAIEGTAVNGMTTLQAESQDLEIIREIDGRGPTIDARARSEYRTRLRDLQAELDEAERNNDLGRSDRLRTEVETLGQELASSFGMGGARAHSVAERGTCARGCRQEHSFGSKKNSRSAPGVGASFWRDDKHWQLLLLSARPRPPYRLATLVGTRRSAAICSQTHRAFVPSNFPLFLQFSRLSDRRARLPERRPDLGRT